MKITDELLDKMARLARLEIPAEEREDLKKDFQKMLNFVDKLQEVDTQDVEPLIHMTDSANRLREDIPQGNLDREAILKNAPDADAPYFRVPKILDK